MQFSFQLYSARNFPPLSETLRLLASLGYSEVEGYGDLFIDLEQAKALRGDLDASGLTMPSAHIGLDMVENETSSVIEVAKSLGITKVFGPHLADDQRPGDMDGWHAFGARLDAAGKPLENAGIRFGWHNHDFEFSKGAAVHPMDAIFENAPNLAFEFDLAWCVRAGVDHLAFIEKHADRMVAAHIKDIAPAGENPGEDGWADVGDGVIDWPATFDALSKTACQHFVAEHDNPSDLERFARRSIAFLKAL